LEDHREAVRGSCGRHGAVFGEELYRIGNKFRFGSGIITSVATVVGQCWACIERVFGMGGPGPSIGFVFVYFDLAGCWGEWCFVEIKLSVDLRIG
jgi:hypothetical protein